MMEKFNRIFSSSGGEASTPMEKTFFAAIALVAVLVLAGCAAGPMPGSDRDAHGCIASAGYIWCEPLSACIRPWETDCASASEVKLLTENFPPFSFTGVDGTIEGTSTNTVRLILGKLGLASNITLMNWPSAYEMALAEPNTALYSMARSPQREHLFKWVGPIGTYEKTLYAKAGSGMQVASLGAAKNAQSICVVQYDDREQLLSGLGFSNLVMKGSDTECMQALAAGEVELWLGSSDNMPYVGAEIGMLKTAVTPVLEVERSEIYIAFSNSTSDKIVAEWQSALDSLKRDGMLGTK